MATRRSARLRDAEDTELTAITPSSTAVAPWLCPSAPLVNATAQEYLNGCQAFKKEPDGGILACLVAEHSVCRATSAFGDGDLLPMGRIFAKATHIRELDLSFSKNRSAMNFFVLGQALKLSPSIVCLRLRKCGMGQVHLQHLMDGLQRNAAVQTVDLSDNPLGEYKNRSRSEVLLVSLASEMPSLQELNVSRCKLEQSVFCDLISTAGARDRPFKLIIDGNCPREEMLNSASHALGAVLSLGGALMLVYRAANRGFTAAVIARVSVFALSAITMFSCSSLFHAFSVYLERTSVVFQALDHAVIFILIAGSYTGFSAAVGDAPCGIFILVAEWLLALAGILLGLYAPLWSARAQRLATVTELCMYVLMGWLGVPFGLIELINTRIGEDATWLVYAGGINYTGGIIFFLLGANKPFYHFVWHVFVLAAFACHFFAIYIHVLGGPVF